MYKVSVVTICYNCESSIEKTIKSVIEQTYPNIEYLVIDGKSKDSTMEIVNLYKDKIDYISSEPDKGIYDAMNKGIEHATGDWIIFMNAGDSFYNNQVLETFIPMIEKDTLIAHGDIMYLANGFKARSTYVPIEEMSNRMTVKHQATFTRLAYHKKNPFDISFRSSGDYDFFYKAYYRDHVKYQYIPLVVSYFDNSGTSNIHFRRSYRENLRIWGKEKDWHYRLKQEFMFFVWDLKKIVKSLIWNKEQIKVHEMKRLAKRGYRMEE